MAGSEREGEILTINLSGTCIAKTMGAGFVARIPDRWKTTRGKMPKRSDFIVEIVE